MLRRTPVPGVYRTKDIAVIVVLWLSDVLNPWVYGWLNFTLKVLFGEDWNVTGKFRTYGPVLLFAKCATCIGLSVLADLKNGKALAFFISLFFASLTPLCAIATVASRSEVVALITLSVSYVFFAVTPIRYVLIFNQRLYPSSMQVRKIVTALEVAKSLSAFFFYLSEPDPKSFKIPALVVRWVFLIPTTIFVITVTNIVRRYTSLDEPKERTFKSAIIGILRDMKKSLTHDPESRRTAASDIYQFFFFVVLLLPVVTVIIANLVFIKVEHTINERVITGPKVNSNNVIDYRLYAHVANIAAIPLICLLINLFNDSIQTFADYLLLSLGHLVNSVVLVYLTVSLVAQDFGNTYQFDPHDNISSIKNVSSDIVKPGVAVVHIFSCELSSKVYISTPHSNYTLNEGADLVVFSVTMTTYEILYSWKAWTKTYPTPWEISLTLQPNRRYFYTITPFGETDRIYSIVQYFGGETFHPQVSPVVLVGNGLVRPLVNDSYFRTFLAYAQNSPDRKIRLSLPDERMVSKVSFPAPGEWVFQYNGTRELLQDEIELTLTRTLELYSETFMGFADYGGGEHFSDLCMFFKPIVSFNLSDLVINEVAQKAYNPPINAIKGVGAAAISVGYLQFFWLESPLRFRTTLLSLVVVGEEITSYTIDYAVTKVTNYIAISLTTMVVCLGIVHVVVGRIYETKFRRELRFIADRVDHPLRNLS